MITLLPDSDPMLHRATKPFVDWPNAENMANILINTMNEFRAVGLAANQVGLDISICAVKFHDGDLVMFNPIISDLSTNSCVLNEGCLTYPNLYLNISRPITCIVKYQDVMGHHHERFLEGLDARIAQHEIDHLNGKTFVSLVSRLRLSMAKNKAKKVKKT